MRTFGDRQRLSYEEFAAKHLRELSDLGHLFENDFTCVGNSGATLQAALVRREHVPRWMREMQRNPFFRLLGAAKAESCPDAYERLLFWGLWKIGGAPPDLVFAGERGEPGRPRNQQTSIIYSKWLELGQPRLGTQKLAHAIYGIDFAKANGRDRKKMIDRCRQAVARHQAHLRLNPKHISSQKISSD